MNKQSILFSGIQPTGIPHLGNYLGALQNWVMLQRDYHAIYAIVDYHALTVDMDPAELATYVRTTAKTLIAIGIDPKRSVLFVQSHLSEHTELAWIFNCITPVSEMERMTQYKDKAKQHKQNINMGLFDYPALMAADILLYRAETVPVGEDQLQHIELTRLIARKFNRRFGNFFPEPKALLTQAKRVMALSDPNKKMSKSLGEQSYISLIDSPETIKKKIMRAVTDTGPADSQEMSQGIANLFNLLNWFGNEAAYRKNQTAYRGGKLRYADLKQDVCETIISTLTPIRKKYEEISDGQITKLLKQGEVKASTLAAANLKKIKELIGLR